MRHVFNTISGILCVLNFITHEPQDKFLEINDLRHIIDIYSFFNSKSQVLWGKLSFVSKY